MNRSRRPGEARIRGASGRGGAFWDHETGIPLGCPLSPPIGAFFLHELDRRMETSGLFDVPFGRAGLRRKKRLPGSPFAGDFLMG